MPMRDLAAAARDRGSKSVSVDLYRMHRTLLAVAIALIAVVFLAFALGWDVFTQIRPEWPEISPYTAAGFVVLAIALVLLDRKERAAVITGRVLAGFTLLLGAGLDFAVSSGMLPSEDAQPTTSWNWISLLPSAASVATAASVLLIDLGGPRIARTRFWLAVFAALVALLGLLSFVYESASIFQQLGLSGTSMPTTVIGLFLIGASLTARPEEPPLSTLDARYDASILRRVLPMLLVAPFIPAAVGWAVHRVDSDASSAEAIAQLATVVILCAVVVIVGGAQSRTLRDLRTVQARVWSAFANTPASTCIVDRSGLIATVNSAMCRMLGLTEQQLVSTRFADLVIDYDKAIVNRKIARVIDGEVGEFRADVRLRKSSGGRIWVDLSMAAAYDNEGRVAYLVSQFTDLTDRKQLERVLAEQATRDSLTGLLNRDGLTRRIEYMQQHLPEGQVLAIVYADVDGLKPLNDIGGHAAGDELLREVGRRLQAVTREDDAVARVGGDEFVIVTTLAATEAAAKDAVVARLRTELSGPVVVGAEVVDLSVSLGAAIHDGGAGSTAAEALAEADQAMYEDKFSRRAADRA